MTETTTTVQSAPVRGVAPRKTDNWKGVRSVGKHLLLSAAAILMIYPLLWMLVSSFRPTEVIFRDTSLWLTTFQFDNYTQGWNALNAPFSLYLWNSTVIALGCIIGNILSCSLAAYAFARLKFRGRPLLFALMLMTLMLPIHVVIVPQYVMFSQIGWVNTFWPLILPRFLATEAFFVFLMVQFIRGLPKDLDEAARIDGCGHFRIFFNVLLPLMVPAIATTAIFTFIWSWNDFFAALIYLTAPDKFTVPLALKGFLDATGGSNWGAMFAMSIVSLLPIFFAFLFGQRFLIRGIATTGIK